MTEFLKIDLDQGQQPALVRLRDDVTNITQAIFSDTGAALTCFGTDVKTKRFMLDAKTMTALCEGWMDYCNLVAHHADDLERRKEAEKTAQASIIEEAKALASSVTFDLESLNITIEESISYDGWNVLVPALAYKRYIDSCDVTKYLITLVQNTFDYIKADIEVSENWDRELHDEWKAIVASYRRVFPLEQCQLCQKSFDLRELKKLGTGCEMLIVCDSCGQEELKRRDAKQGEPEEITEARRLLKESLHITEWANSSIYPGSKPGTWTFQRGPFGEGEISIIDKSPVHLLTDIIDYLLVKQIPEQGELSPEAINAVEELSAAIKEASANYVDPETIIAQVRELLTNDGFTGWTLERGYPGTNIDSWGFIHGGELVFANKPATEALDSIRKHMGRCLASEKYSGVQVPESIAALPE